MKLNSRIRSGKTRFAGLAVVLVLAIAFSMAAGNKKLHEAGIAANDTTRWPRSFGFGRTANPEAIARIDIDIRPGGQGSPPGTGSVASGKRIYDAKCASCHGKNGKEGPSSILVGAMGDTTKAKTIGNYWPYATTLFDYVRRAMPYNLPGSLSDNEVYHLTAFLLFKNKIIDSATVVNARTLPQIKMPAQRRFVNDDRRGGPEVR